MYLGVVEGVTKNPNLKFFAKAIRLAVLTQTSSCAVERVFSQFKIIIETVGENVFEDMIEIRMLMRNNGDLNTLYCHT